MFLKTHLPNLQTIYYRNLNCLEMIVLNLNSMDPMMLMANFEHCQLADDDYWTNNQMMMSVENDNHLDDDHDPNDFLF